ncbi:VTT domain-containing protein [Streptomyces tubbatahanensis]|uniref:VTT domain-containing protein n=1 Tax=Streptomyces tubbatahanensis TaxID=2923272 RepID=A0ABY3XLJ8_9ACTN|nr:VTT domain-containing protein [Streptomyces tubbatahanensis]UNS95285.1 VTT domain-containing protein [Streptomyces tubbatahanensis]
MTSLTAALGQVPAATAYLVLAGAVLAESVLLIGALIPTLTLLLAAGALARAGHLHPLLVLTTAAGAVVAGDFLAHRTGRLLGTRLRGARIGRRVPATAWQRAEALMARRGGQALLLARFVPVVRTLAPHLAGASGVPYRRIAPCSVLAASLWATAEAGAGYAAAASPRSALTLGAPAAVAVLAAGGALLWTRARRRPACRAHATSRPAEGGRLRAPGPYLAAAARVCRERRART